MTFKESIRKEHENNVKCFGKKHTIIIYVWTSLLVIIASITAILNVVFKDNRLFIVFCFITSLIAILSLIYMVIISRFERKEENKK